MTHRRFPTAFLTSSWRLIASRRMCRRVPSYPSFNRRRRMLQQDFGESFKDLSEEHVYLNVVLDSGVFNTVSLTGFSKDLMKVITNETVVSKTPIPLTLEKRRSLEHMLTSSGAQAGFKHKHFREAYSSLTMSSPSHRTSSPTAPSPPTLQTVHAD